MTDPTRPALFDEELLSLVMNAVRVGEIVATLGWARPNRIEAIEREGIWVATEKSDREGGQAQLVPAWMIAAGWEHLRRHCRLDQQYLVNNLRVNRSAFVCALLAKFPNVVVETSPRIGLRLLDDQGQAGVEAAVTKEEATASTGRGDEPSPPRTAEPAPTTRVIGRATQPDTPRNTSWQAYTATGRDGKTVIRRFTRLMTHAVDIDGRVCRFHGSRKEAEADAERMLAWGRDAKVTTATRYVPGDLSSLRRNVAVDPGDSVVGREAPVPGDTSRRELSAFSMRLNHLFATVHPEDRGPYTSYEVAEALQEDGILIHGSSISRLRVDTDGPPADDIVFALAFFFNVDPEYLLAGEVRAPFGAEEPAAERKSVIAQRVAERPDDHPSLKAAPRPQSSGTNAVFTTADLLRVIAGLSKSLGITTTDRRRTQSLCNG